MAEQTFFRTIHDGESELEPEAFLLEVENRFQSGEIHKEVRWRLKVLKELAATDTLNEIGVGLRKELSKIFATVSDEAEILVKLKDLTEVEGADGNAVDLRRFLKREKRTLNAEEYRKILLKKISNTSSQIKNLSLFFPESQKEMSELAGAMEKLAGSLYDPSTDIRKIKGAEDKLRQSPPFAHYEEAKETFLKQWLERFGKLSEAEIAKLAPEEIQRMIMEHQRHQMTQLLKSEINQSDLDMTEHLEPHDTLEANFGDATFWHGANNAVKIGFKDWIIGAIQAFGMLKGQSFTLFQNEKEPEHYLLFAVGVGQISGPADQMVEMVPFVKPFTRKAGYLLEVRKRDIADTQEYHAELRHYLMPFLFAFDGMRDFNINGELLSFFTSNY